MKSLPLFNFESKRICLDFFMYSLWNRSFPRITGAPTTRRGSRASKRRRGSILSCGQFKSAFCAVITRQPRQSPPLPSYYPIIPCNRRLVLLLLLSTWKGSRSRRPSECECVRSLFRIMPGPSLCRENRANLHRMHVVLAHVISAQESATCTRTR